MEALIKTSAYTDRTPPEVPEIKKIEKFLRKVNEASIKHVPQQLIGLTAVFGNQSS